MDTKAILIAARKVIENESDWYGGGNSNSCGDTKCCAQTAISRIVEHEEAKPAFRALLAAAGVQGDVGSDLWRWNDAPERKHADVLAAFDKAIAIA